MGYSERQVELQYSLLQATGTSQAELTTRAVYTYTDILVYKKILATSPQVCALQVELDTADTSTLVQQHCVLCRNRHSMIQVELKSHPGHKYVRLV